MEKLSHTIMRQIYYAYAVHLFTRPVVRRGVPLAILSVALSMVVSLGDVWLNLSQTGFRDADLFILSALEKTEWWTLAILAGILLVSVLALKDMLKNRPLRASWSRAS